MNMILSICDEPNILKVLRIINLFVSIIKVVVPIILVLSLMIKFASAVTKNDNDILTSVKKTVVPSVVAAVLIFLIPTFINIIVAISFPNGEFNSCLSIKTLEQLDEAYEKKMEKYIDIVKESLKINDYNYAVNYLENINNEEKKNFNIYYRTADDE